MAKRLVVERAAERDLTDQVEHIAHEQLAAARHRCRGLASALAHQNPISGSWLSSARASRQNG